MRQSNVLLILIWAVILTFGTALPTTARSDQTLKTLKTTELNSGRSVIDDQDNVGHGKRYLRDGDTSTRDENQEERVFNFSALKRLIPGTATNKAAKAAKEAAKKVEQAKGLDEMLANPNIMYKQFKAGKKQGIDDGDVAAKLNELGRTSQKETSMLNQFGQYLKDFGAGRAAAPAA